MRHSGFLLFTMLAVTAIPVSAYADLPCTTHSTALNVELQSPLLDEISGMALSRTNNGIIWAHTDSGGEAELYALDTSGSYIQTVKVNGAVNTDWEDIAAGPCSPEHLDSHCLYIADMGDNLFKRTDKRILVVPDPKLSSDPNQTVEVNVLRTIFVSYTGFQEQEAKFKNPDSESIMVDPRDASIYIVSKQSSGGVQTLYRIEPQSCGERMAAAAIPLASYTYTSLLGSIKSLMNAVTAADFAPDGTHYVIRTYAATYEYDVTSKSVAEAFLAPSSEFPSPELQGEAIAYLADGKTILTAAEKYESIAPKPLFHVNICETTPAEAQTYTPGTSVKRPTVDSQAICSAANAVSDSVFKVDGVLTHEICDNNIDDNKNGLRDCQDPECLDDKACTSYVVPFEICGNEIDDDDNGATDCDDAACADDPACQPRVEICGNEIDDDDNGATDCDDPACADDPACKKIAEICDNGVDDDGNDLSDCDDPACEMTDHCTAVFVPEICDNEIDDSGNGLIDCNDPSCVEDEHCAQHEQKVEICDNEIDDSGNGLIDCKDPACATHDACKEGGSTGTPESGSSTDESSDSQNQDTSSNSNSKGSDDSGCACTSLRSVSNVSWVSLLMALFVGLIFWRRRSAH